MEAMQRFTQRYRYSAILLKELVRTDFKLRYQGSALGYLWSLLRPLFLFVILYFVFARFLKVGDTIPHFPVYLLLGIVLWNYFVEVTSGSVTAIVSKGDILRKLNFPRYVIILAGSFSALINLALNFVVIGIFMVLSDVPVTWHALWIIPIIVQLFIFAIGLAFFLSALFVRFRDVSYIWDVVIQAAFYATPILYPISQIPLSAAKILMLNPMAQMIQDARYVLVTPASQTVSHIYDNSLIRLVPISISILIAALAAVYFKKRSKHFAEEV
jgi:ABC-2 type transport system permease protein